MTAQSRYICEVRVDAVNYDDAVDQVMDWARRGESRMLCFSTVHMIMEANDRPHFERVLQGADVVAPDGMPLVWALRLLGLRHASRVYGPDFTQRVAEAAAREGIPLGLYGGSPQALQSLVAALEKRHPSLRIAYASAPPFRALTPTEHAQDVEDIRSSGARIVLVGLGCPKQEQWMAENRGSLPAVMLGVGAAFDFLSGMKPQAPRWMMDIGLEWLFRLVTEPRRLWARYLRQNPRFIGRFLMQLLKTRSTRVIDAPGAGLSLPKE